MHIPGLSNPMTPVLRLRIHGRIPIAIIEDNSIGPRKIDPHTTRPRRQNKTEDPFIIIKPLHQNLPLIHLRRSIEPQINMSMVIQKRL